MCENCNNYQDLIAQLRQENQELRQRLNNSLEMLGPGEVAIKLTHRIIQLEVIHDDQGEPISLDAFTRLRYGVTYTIDGERITKIQTDFSERINREMAILGPNLRKAQRQYGLERRGIAMSARQNGYTETDYRNFGDQVIRDHFTECANRIAGINWRWHPIMD